MNNLLRRMTLGFRKDREEMSMTIGMHLSILLLYSRRCLKNLVMAGIVGSTIYWLGFLTMSLSPISMLTNPLWLIYAPEYRDFAARFALGIVFIGGILYSYRLYEIGKFMEERYIEEDILFSEAQVRTYSKILDEEENSVGRPSGQSSDF